MEGVGGNTTISRIGEFIQKVVTLIVRLIDRIYDIDINWI